jgi:hypothetical protein
MEESRKRRVRKTLSKTPPAKSHMGKHGLAILIASLWFENLEVPLAKLLLLFEVAASRSGMTHKSISIRFPYAEGAMRAWVYELMRDGYIASNKFKDSRVVYYTVTTDGLTKLQYWEQELEKLVRNRIKYPMNAENNRVWHRVLVAGTTAPGED